MRTEYIVTAKTVDEAYKKAVDLYSSLGDISLEEVITPGKKGFLGLFGTVPAEIKISVDDGKEERKPKIQQQKNVEKKNNQPKKNNAPEKKGEKKPAKAEPKPEAKAESKAPTVDPVKAKGEEINVTVEEKTLAINFLKGFIRDIGFDCEVKGDLTKNEKGFVSRLITIEGKDAPSLIGHRGEMLDAIQYLSNLC